MNSMISRKALIQIEKEDLFLKKIKTVPLKRYITDAYYNLKFLKR